MAIDTETAARRVVEVIPRVMRTLALEFRTTGHLPAPVHCGLLVALAECCLASSQDLGVQIDTLPGAADAALRADALLFGEDDARAVVGAVEGLLGRRFGIRDEELAAIEASPADPDAQAEDL